MSPGPQKQFCPEDVLEKAMHLFWQSGYDGTSMSQILSVAGIGKKSFYDTFGNKRQLFLKSLDLYAARGLQAIRDKLNRPGSQLENIEDLLKAFHEGPCTGCFLATNIADFDFKDEEVSHRLCHHLKNIETEFQQALERAQKEGEIAAELPTKQLAHSLTCLSQGNALVARIGSCPQRQEHSIDGFIKLLRTTRP